MKELGIWLARFAAFGGVITVALTAEKWVDLLTPVLRDLLG